MPSARGEPQRVLLATTCVPRVRPMISVQLGPRRPRRAPAIANPPLRVTAFWTVCVMRGIPSVPTTLRTRVSRALRARTKTLWAPNRAPRAERTHTTQKLRRQPCPAAVHAQWEQRPSAVRTNRRTARATKVTAAVPARIARRVSAERTVLVSTDRAPRIFARSVR